MSDLALRERLRSLFVTELDDAVRALDDGLLRLHADAVSGNSADRELLRELFRLAHGLKGAALSADVGAAVQVARQLEESLARLRDLDRPLTAADVEPLLPQVDALAAVGTELLDSAHAPARPPAPGGPADSPRSRPQAPRVSPAKLDAVRSRASELVAVTRRIERLADELDARSGSGHPGEDDRAATDRLATDAATLARDLGRLTAHLVDATADLAHVSVHEGTDGLSRAVHDLAIRSGKDVRLEVAGTDAEADRSVISALREPLLHLVRNAVDHGIETPAARVEAGKEATGTVRMTACIRDGRLEVQVADDGRGIDVEAVGRAARGLGLDVEDELHLVFVPGVTTVGEVTDVSGRGIGLDAVRDRVEAIGGSVRLDNRPGAGLSVTIDVPVTTAVLRMLTVRVGDQVVGLPSASIRRLRSVGADEIVTVAGRLLLADGGEQLAVLPLGAVAGLAADVTTDPLHVAVVDTADRPVALAVDSFVDEVELAVTRPPARLAGLPVVLGAAVLPDGTPLLVLNPAACVRRGLHDEVVLRSAEPPHDDGRRRVLLVEDSFTTRALERSILEAAGYDVRTASDGSEAWQVLQHHDVDVVVSDVHMPAMDGIELCRRIRSSDRLAGIPIVLVSSLAADDDRRRGAEAGADAYVVKADFDQETLLDTIARLV